MSSSISNSDFERRVQRLLKPENENQVVQPSADSVLTQQGEEAGSRTSVVVRAFLLAVVCVAAILVLFQLIANNNSQDAELWETDAALMAKIPQVNDLTPHPIAGSCLMQVTASDTRITEGPSYTVTFGSNGAPDLKAFYLEGAQGVSIRPGTRDVVLAADTFVGTLDTITFSPTNREVNIYLFNADGQPVFAGRSIWVIASALKYGPAPCDPFNM